MASLAGGLGCASVASLPATADAAGDGSSESYPPRWTEHLALKDRAATESALDEPLQPNSEWLTLGRSSGVEPAQERTIKTCREYQQARAEGYDSRSGFEIAQESFFKTRCTPLIFLQRARPARISYLHELRLDRDAPSLLPAAMNFEVGEITAEQDALLAAGARLKEFSPELIVKEESATSVVLAEPGTEGHVDLIAWGDYDHDGVEDALFCVASYATEGTYRSYSHVIATRRSAGGPLTVLASDLPE